MSTDDEALIEGARRAAQEAVRQLTGKARLAARLLVRVARAAARRPCSATRSWRSRRRSTARPSAASTPSASSRARLAPAASTTRASPSWLSEMRLAGSRARGTARRSRHRARDRSLCASGSSAPSSTWPQTLMRATRLAQVISVLGNEQDLETTVERVAIEVGELFFADMALLILDSDDGLSVAGHWGIAAADLPPEPFALPEVEEATRLRSVRVGPVDGGAAARLACVLLPSPRRLGTAARRRPLARADAAGPPRRRALRGLRGDRAARGRLPHRAGDRERPAPQAHEGSARAAPPSAAADGGARRHARARRRRAARRRHARLRGGGLGERRADRPRTASSWCCRARRAARDLGIAVDGGRAAAARRSLEELPARGRRQDASGSWPSPARRRSAPSSTQLLLHLVSLGALSLDKALLYEQSREQARHDSLTGLLGHRVFHEVLDGADRRRRPRSACCCSTSTTSSRSTTSTATRPATVRCASCPTRFGGATRSGDTVFRIGGEEFCALLPGLAEQDAFAVAEGMRQRVAAIVSTLAEPGHGQRRRRQLPGARTASETSCWPRRRRAVRLQARREEPHEHRR